MVQLIQAKYEELTAVSSSFTELSGRVEQIYQSLRNSKNDLHGEWEGFGWDRFDSEMEESILPSLSKLQQALENASELTSRISEQFLDTEMTSADMILGATVNNQSLVPFGNGLPFEPGLGATGHLGFPYGTPLAPSSSGPPSPWYTSVFAGPSALLSPGPVPILGPRGLVPPTLNSNVGSRFWVYYGGGGTDTIFSMHPHSGWGRPGYNIPKPNIRLDYGHVGGKHAPTPGNYFHWNQKGGMYNQGAGSYWRTFSGQAIPDHTLLQSAPYNSRFSSITGAKWVRGASRTFAVTGAALDVYAVATADNKVEEGVRRATAWGGAYAGAKGGAALGATIGTFIAPGPGTAIGGAIGGLAGGIGGYVAGYELGDHIHDFGSSAVDWGADQLDNAGEFIEDVGGFISNPITSIGGWLSG